ncbi:MAG: hypothetical protein AAF662_06135 [Pseudomonadota bacterium]
MKYCSFWINCFAIVSAATANFVDTAESHLLHNSAERCWGPDAGIDVANSYCGTDVIPDHLRFFVVANVLSADWDDPNEMPNYVAYYTDLNEREALVFIDKLRPLISDMGDANRRALKEAACVPDLNELSSTRAMAALNLLEDVNDAVLFMYFAMVKLSLTERQAAALQALLSHSSATIVRSDFSEVYKANPEGAKRKLLQLCGR